jgi:transposase
MDDKDVIIARQQKEIKELHALIAQLRDKIARLEKNSSNSSKPPSSDIVDPPPARTKKKKRKIGGQKGHPKHTRRPFSADEVDRVVSGVVVCDYYSANKKFINDCRILVQYCWAHLVRDIKFLTTLSYKAAQRWAEALLGILRKLFELWKTRRQRHPGRYQRMIEKWRKRFLQKVRKPPNHNEAWNIRDRFKGAGEKGYFLFLEREGVPPTNNGTEQAIRFVVIDRRVTQGTRSDAGMRFCERVWTVVATCNRHKRSEFQFFLDAIKATLNPNLPYPNLIPANL